MGALPNGGRELLIRFTCERCGAKQLEPYDPNILKGFDSLRHYKPPKDWYTIVLVRGNESRLLCPNCMKFIDEFIWNM